MNERRDRVDENAERIRGVRQARLYREARERGELQGAQVAEIASYALPFVIHHHRRCRECRDYWTVDCLNGATPPVRDPFWRCHECRSPRRELRSVGEAEAAIAAEREPQLDLLSSSPSEAIAMLGDQLDTEDDEAGTRPAPEIVSVADAGEPIESAGRPQPGGGRQHG